MNDHDEIPAPLFKKMVLLGMAIGCTIGLAFAQSGHTDWVIALAGALSVVVGCLLMWLNDPYAALRLPGQHRDLAELAIGAQARRYLIDPVDGVALVCRTQRHRFRRVPEISRTLYTDVISIRDSGAREAMLPVDVFLLGPRKLVLHVTTAYPVRVDEYGDITYADDHNDRALVPTSRQLRKAARFATSTGAIFATAEHADTLITQLRRSQEHPPRNLDRNDDNPC